MKKTVKLSELLGGMRALNALVGKRLTSWSKTRLLAKYYAAAAEEVEAYSAEVQRLGEEYPDKSGGEYEQRLAVLLAAEVTLDIPTLTEADFADTSDLPTPADMYLLGKIINFDEGEDEGDKS